MKKHVLLRTPLLKLMLAAGTVCATDAAFGHHSYAAYDLAAPMTVVGTVAKLEWSNPHVFLWLYVPRNRGSGYDLWSFEGGRVEITDPHAPGGAQFTPPAFGNSPK